MGTNCNIYITFKSHYHRKGRFPGPGNLDSNAFKTFKTFVFSLLKNLCTHIFSALAPTDIFPLLPENELVTEVIINSFMTEVAIM